VNASLPAYFVSLNLDIEELDAQFAEDDGLHVNPLGVKGLGEIAVVGVRQLSRTQYFARRVRDCANYQSGLKIHCAPVELAPLILD
jgi:xanthine dehydrogenase YagR molybdenum-binding subunit